MTASMYTLLVLALIFANLPFVSGKWFGIVRLVKKHFGHHLLEWLAGFAVCVVLGYILEKRAGSVHSQDWEFWVTVLCLYAVAAFPGFVWRYFWSGRNRE